MKRFLLGSLTAIVLGTGGFQQYRLAGLHRRIASYVSDEQNEVAARILVSRASSRDGEVAIEMHSMAGQESVSEVKTLIEEIVSEVLTLSQGKDYIVNLPASNLGVQRLQELLAGLGSGAALELMSSIDEPLAKSKILSYYEAANPQEYFLFGRSNGKEFPTGFWSFRDWGYLDPVKALQWYREATARGEPVTTDFDMELCAAALQARVAPEQGVAGLKKILQQKPDPLAASEIREIAQKLSFNFRNPEEYASFLAALKSLPPGGTASGTPHLEEVRAQIADWFVVSLGGKSFGEALPLVEQALTSGDKVKYARIRSYLSNAVPAETEAWIHWVCSLDIPSGDRHPLAGYARNQAQREEPPDWVDLITVPEVRNQAIAAFAKEVAARNPLLASQWIEKLPGGTQRDEVARWIGEVWRQSDAVAADAFVKREKDQIQK